MFSRGPCRPTISAQRGPLQKNTDQVYFWAISNFRETSFKVSLGGFHQFHYPLRSLDTADPEAVFAAARADNTGVLCFPSFSVPIPDGQE